MLIGSLTNNAAPQSGFSSSMPMLEVSTHDVTTLPVHYERPSSSGFPRTPALQAFAILEDEENVHNLADEEEELHHFKQRTIETSVCCRLAPNGQLYRGALTNYWVSNVDNSSWLSARTFHW